MTRKPANHRSGLVYDRDWPFARGPTLWNTITTFERRQLMHSNFRLATVRLVDLKNKFYPAPSTQSTTHSMLSSCRMATLPSAARDPRGLSRGIGRLLMVLTLVARRAFAWARTDLARPALCIPRGAGG